MATRNIVVFGLGYVGLSNAALLARRHHVTAVDIDPRRVELVNARRSPIVDAGISELLGCEDLDLTATLDRTCALSADIVIIATPTNYDEATQRFDTSSVESVIDFIETAPAERRPLIVVKSTIPVGFVQREIDKGRDNILFMPEFLREGLALYDNLHPSRIVVGERSERARELAELYREATLEKDVPIVLTGPGEAESVKLFANTFLAMRVAFINELDTFASAMGFDTREILEGMTLDPRIGARYRNPSFGYGGYCLPKDTKQLLANFQGVPQRMVSAIVEANDVRLDWVVHEALARNPKVLGVHRLIMKSGSDNFRGSAMLRILERLKARSEVRTAIYEPTLREDAFEGFEVIHDLEDFKAQCDLILANRTNGELADVAEKVFSRDVYANN